MNEPFILPVTYNGIEHEFKARLERWEYTHRVAVLINDATVMFEPDEEGSYRVLTEQALDTKLLKTVADRLLQLMD